MNFLELAKKRYSCKKYSDKQLTKEQLEVILEAGRLAPTAKNLQEQHIYVVQTPEILEKLDTQTRCRYGAPTMLVVTYDTDNVYTYPDGLHRSGPEDATIVATHMILAAASVDVDSCWINAMNPGGVAEVLNLPANEDVVMLMDLGFAAEGAGPLANHDSRKPLDETVTWL